MRGIDRKKNMLWFRLQILECMRVALKFYKLTGKETFLNYAKDFGQTSELLNNEIKKYD